MNHLIKANHQSHCDFTAHNMRETVLHNKPTH